MIIAKRVEIAHELKRRFQKGEVQKEYHAFLYGAPKRKRGTISLSIGRSKRDPRKKVVRNIRGVAREAVTEYVVVKSCEKSKTSFVRLYPQTGRTHQIRVHMVSLHHPVVCDTLYASGYQSALGFSRLALHARRITVSLCSRNGGEPRTIECIAPYPTDFKEALEQYQAV